MLKYDRAFPILGKPERVAARVCMYVLPNLDTNSIFAYYVIKLNYVFKAHGFSACRVAMPSSNLKAVHTVTNLSYSCTKKLTTAPRHR